MLMRGVSMGMRGKPGSGFRVEQEGRERRERAWKTQGFRYKKAAEGQGELMEMKAAKGRLVCAGVFKQR